MVTRIALRRCGVAILIALVLTRRLIAVALVARLRPAALTGGLVALATPIALSRRAVITGLALGPVAFALPLTRGSICLASPLIVLPLVALIVLSLLALR